MAQPITCAAFAEQRGVSGAAVTRAIKEGRLKKSVSYTPGGRPQIDPELGHAEWDKNTRPDKRNNPNAKSVEVDEDDNPLASYAASRAKKEAYQAELARLEVQTRLGKLVDADEVKREAFNIARRVRDGLLNIPDRISAELAGEGDAFKVHQMLTDEIRKTLTELAEVAKDG